MNTIRLLHTYKMSKTFLATISAWQMRMRANGIMYHINHYTRTQQTPAIVVASDADNMKKLFETTSVHMYRKISDIRRTEFQNWNDSLVSSCSCLCPIHETRC